MALPLRVEIPLVDQTIASNDALRVYANHYCKSLHRNSSANFEFVWLQASSEGNQGSPFTNLHIHLYPSSVFSVLKCN
jgi:hypothetical protein